MIFDGERLFGPSRGYKDKQLPLDEQTIAEYYEIGERNVKNLPDEKVYSAILKIKEKAKGEGKELIQQFRDKKFEKISEEAGVPVRYIGCLNAGTGGSFNVQYKIPR